MSRPILRVAGCLTAVATTFGLLLPGAVVSADAASSTPQVSSRWRACGPSLDKIRTHVAAKQRTVTVVNQTSKTHAQVSFWVRTNSRCSFSRKFLSTTGRLGYGGTVDGTKRKQGTGTTPLGTYTMTGAFGNGAAPDCGCPTTGSERVISGSGTTTARTTTRSAIRVRAGSATGCAARASTHRSICRTTRPSTAMPW